MTDLHAALRRAVTDAAEPGAAELSTALGETLRDEASDGPVVFQRLKSRVYRLRLGESSPERRSFVLKRFDPWLARRNELVARRWLPALGLGDRCPQLYTVAAERSGSWIWHVYEDIGDGAIDPENPDRPSVVAVVELLASLHTRAARHALLPGCRHICGDLGAPYFAANVRDAIAVLERLEQRPVRDRLLDRLYRLRHEQSRRAQALEDLGGPDTLLHGDLWTTNTFVAPPLNGGGPTARLIDWDHAAVGPATYDLSTFLYRFAPCDRPWILEAYARAVAPSGWTLPSGPELNGLFETAEYSRYANRIIWPAVALLEEGAAWGWDTLTEVERWFDAMTPVLPL
jgi:thiamine kinase-like enzyme